MKRRKTSKKLTKLPDKYEVTHEDGYVCVKCKLDHSLRDFDEVNAAVAAWAKKNKLREIGAGTNIMSHVRDWAFEKGKA